MNDAGRRAVPSQFATLFDVSFLKKFFLTSWIPTALCMTNSIRAFSFLKNQLHPTLIHSHYQCQCVRDICTSRLNVLLHFFPAGLSSNSRPHPPNRLPWRADLSWSPPVAEAPGQTSLGSSPTWTRWAGSASTSDRCALLVVVQYAGYPILRVITLPFLWNGILFGSEVGLKPAKVSVYSLLWHLA